MMPSVQKPAPSFSAPVLRNGDFGTLRSDELKGKYSVLFFYPLDFTFVCPTEILAFDAAQPEFAKRGATLTACSIDSVHSHLAWTQLERAKGGIEGVTLPMIGDVKRQVAEAFGVLTDEGVALRATFIMDEEWTVRHATVNDLPIGRSVDETIRVLDALQFADEYGEVCPANWTPGQDAMTPTPKDSKSYFEAQNG